jgi:protocatechuate 3,4-dioxygenase beta subunit
MTIGTPAAPTGFALASYERPAGVNPPLDYPAYRSTALRVPRRPLQVMRQGLTEVTGSLLGRERVIAADADLTTQHEGEPIGERIIVTGRVLDGDGRAVPRHADRDLAGERGRALPARGRPAPGAAGPELHRRGPVHDRLRGPVPVRHHQAGRLPVAEPPQRVARPAHPLLAVRPGVHAAADHPDVLPRGPAVRPGPDLQLRAGGGPGGFRFDIHLQGDQETVFFDV